MDSGNLIYEPKLDLSVVISCYFEEKSIDEFHQRLSTTLEQMGITYEIIYVNDGSTDGTFDKLKAIYQAHPNVTAVVDLFKNVGQGNAKTPGVQLAQGRGLVLIDSDLQLDPEDLPNLVDKFEAGYDVVSGYRRKRKDSWPRKIPSLLANSIMRKASRSTIRDFGCTFKIYDMRIVKAFEFDQFKPWRPVPVIAHAQRIAEIPVNHHPRRYGESGWTFRKLFAYNMENVVNLSERPFQLIALITFAAAMVFLFRIAIAWFYPFSLLGNIANGLILNTIVLALLITVSILSAIGEFVIRNFGLLKKTPAYVIRECMPC